jgi:hypothetical protein
MGKNRFPQYELNRSVRNGRGTSRLAPIGKFFIPSTPIEIKCISTRENMFALCTMGQNLPPVSYLGAYTLQSCICGGKVTDCR